MGLINNPGGEVLPSAYNNIICSDGDDFVLWGFDDESVVITKDDIIRMYEIVFNEGSEKKKRYNEYLNDPILKSLRDKLEHVLTYQAMPGIQYPKEIQEKVIPYEQAQLIIKYILAQIREYRRVNFSDILNFKDESTE